MRLAKPGLAMLGWLLPAAALLIGAPTAGAALPRLDLRQPLAAGTVHHAPGLRSAAPTAQALAGSVQQLTGLEPAQVAAENVCPAPSAGQAACAAQALVLRADHRLVHPGVDRRATFTQVFPTHRHGDGAVTAPPAGITSSSATPPAAGTPAYLQQAYDLTYLSQTAGGSDTVGVVDAGDDPNAATDLATYRSAYGLPPCTTATGCFAKVNQNGGSLPLPPSAGSGWSEEESLDLDAVSALCPNCHILLVEANSAYITDLDPGIATAVTLGANQVSNSFGSLSSSPVGIGSFPGATIVAATGDHGYAGAGVSQYPAAYPGVTAVGGTTLSAAGDSTSLRGYSESGWSLNSSGTGWGGGSGCDLNSVKPSYQSDNGCAGRSYSDVSADANPDTGLRVYDSSDGGWLLMGGTSLASPLVAAYEGLTGVNGATAQWAYADSALLNDPATGSSGSCAANIAYICNAGTGYDGPTGIGSISGDIVAGAPGIGGPAIGGGSNNTYTQAVAATTANLTAGVYPNGLDTTYSWQYGTSTAYGQQTSSSDIGPGATPVATPATLSRLTPGTTYHYRLVATNSDGTDYGYGYTLTTASATSVPPVSTIAPSTSGSALQGQTLTAGTGNWSPTASSYGYQWQRSTSGGTTWANIAGATSSTYTVATTDLGADLQVSVTATNSFGVGAATSAVAGPVGSGAPVAISALSISGYPNQGQVLSAVSTWNPGGTAYTYQWQSSSDGDATWTNVTGATGPAYTLTVADLTNDLRVTVSAANTYGQTSSTSAAVGPVQANAPINTAAPTVTGTAQRTGTLSATAGSWTGAGNVLTDQWQRSADGTAWTSIAGATGASYNLVVADEGDTVRVLVTATTRFGVTGTPSPPTGIIAPYPPANSAAPAVTGTAERGATLNATPGTWTGPDNVYAYQWQQDSGEGYVNISGATAAMYTLGVADEGATVRVIVSATDPDATISQASAPTSTVTDAIPVNQTTPTVTGVAQRGSTLTATAGTWAGIDNAYSYQWERSPDGITWTNAAAATGITYSVAGADEGYELRVLVTATNPDGSTSATSGPTGAVVAPPVDLTAPAAPSGTLMTGFTLTPDTGSWDSPVTYTYTWLRCPGTATSVSSSCNPVSSATTYTLRTSDVGSELGVTVNATSIWGATTVNSALTGVITGLPLTNTTAPSISGNPQAPNTLSANAGTWSVSPSTVSYQWERCNADSVSGCTVTATTGGQYSLTSADIGHTIVLIADVTSPGQTGTAQSPPLTVQAQPLPQATVLPAVSGTPTRTFSVAAAGGTWSNSPTGLAYQWEQCNAAGVSCTAIPGATQVTYQLTAADEGFTVTVAVTATNSSGATTALAGPTAVVAGLVPVVTHAPALSTVGVRQSAPLSVGNAGWQATSDTTYATQWERCNSSGAACAAISGATAGAYTPVAADVGQTLAAMITATNVDGSVTSASPPSDVVLPAAPRWRDLPVLNATNGDVGGTLTITPGVWTGPIVSADATQLMRCTYTCVSISSTSSYTIASADTGAILRVRETATNAGGSTVVWSAQYVGPVASATSASAVLSDRETVLRTNDGAPLAVAAISSRAAVTSDAMVAGNAWHGPSVIRSVAVHRAAKVRGKLRAWVCPVNTGRGRAPLPCTRPVALTRSARLKLPAAMTGKIRIVVVRRGR